MTAFEALPTELLRPPADRTVLIRGAYVITMDPAIGEGFLDVLVHGSNIELVAPRIDITDSAEVIRVEADGQILIPGLIDSHVHAWEGALRGTDPSAQFEGYMAVTHAGVAPFMTPDDIAIGQRVTAAQAMNGGVTTIIDNSHNCRSPEHSRAAVQGLLDSGIRAVHAPGPPIITDERSAFPDDFLRLRAELFSSENQLLTFMMFDVQPSQATWEFAARNDLSVVAEVGPWIPGLGDLLRSGLPSPRHTYNHCSRLGGSDWDLLADAGVNVNLVPRSDSFFALGAFAPVLEPQRRDMEFGLSLDNEVSYAHNMFEEMRTLVVIQRGLACQAEIDGDAYVPSALGPADALKAATVGGARNAQLSNRIGSISPGKAADLVLLNLTGVHTRPFGSWLGTAVNWCNPSDVDTVFIDGRVRKWRGNLVEVDYDELCSQAEASRERLWSLVGLSLDDVRAGRAGERIRMREDEAVRSMLATANDVV